jgi:hypothetical protein
MAPKEYAAKIAFFFFFLKVIQTTKTHQIICFFPSGGGHILGSGYPFTPKTF